MLNGQSCCNRTMNSGAPVNTVCCRPRSGFFVGCSCYRRRKSAICLYRRMRTRVEVYAGSKMEMHRPSKPETVDQEGQLVREGEEEQGETKFNYYNLQQRVQQKRTLKEVLKRSKLSDGVGPQHQPLKQNIQFQQKLQGYYAPRKNPTETFKSRLEAGTHVTRMTAQTLNNQRKKAKKQRQLQQQQHQQQLGAQGNVIPDSNLIEQNNPNVYLDPTYSSYQQQSMSQQDQYSQFGYHAQNGVNKQPAGGISYSLDQPIQIQQVYPQKKQTPAYPFTNAVNADPSIQSDYTSKFDIEQNQSVSSALPPSTNANQYSNAQRGDFNQYQMSQQGISQASSSQQYEVGQNNKSMQASQTDQTGYDYSQQLYNQSNGIPLEQGWSGQNPALSETGESIIQAQSVDTQQQSQQEQQESQEQEESQDILIDICDGDEASLIQQLSGIKKDKPAQSKKSSKKKSKNKSKDKANKKGKKSTEVPIEAVASTEPKSSNPSPSPSEGSATPATSISAQDKDPSTITTNTPISNTSTSSPVAKTTSSQNPTSSTNQAPFPSRISTTSAQSIDVKSTSSQDSIPAPIHTTIPSKGTSQATNAKPTSSQPTTKPTVTKAAVAKQISNLSSTPTPTPIPTPSISTQNSKGLTPASVVSNTHSSSKTPTSTNVTSTTAIPAPVEAPAPSPVQIEASRVPATVTANISEVRSTASVSDTASMNGKPSLSTSNTLESQIPKNTQIPVSEVVFNLSSQSDSFGKYNVDQFISSVSLYLMSKVPDVWNQLLHSPEINEQTEQAQKNLPQIEWTEKSVPQLWGKLIQTDSSQRPATAIWKNLLQKQTYGSDSSARQVEHVSEKQKQLPEQIEEDKEIVQPSVKENYKVSVLDDVIEQSQKKQAADVSQQYRSKPLKQKQNQKQQEDNKVQSHAKPSNNNVVTKPIDDATPKPNTTRSPQQIRQTTVRSTGSVRQRPSAASTPKVGVPLKPVANCSAGSGATANPKTDITKKSNDKASPKTTSTPTVVPIAAANQDNDSVDSNIKSENMSQFRVPKSLISSPAAVGATKLTQVTKNITDSPNDNTPTSDVQTPAATPTPATDATFDDNVSVSQPSLPTPIANPQQKVGSKLIALARSKLTGNMVSPKDIPFKYGDLVIGKVVKENSQNVMVEIKGCPQVWGRVLMTDLPLTLRVPSTQLEHQVPNRIQAQKEMLPVGLVRQFKVIRIPDQFELNMGRGPLLSAYDVDLNTITLRAEKIIEICQSYKEMIDMTIDKVVPAGLQGSVAGIPAFVPKTFIPSPQAVSSQMPGNDALNNEHQWTYQNLCSAFMNQVVKVVAISKNSYNGSSNRITHRQGSNNQRQQQSQNKRVEIICSINKAFEFKAQEDLQVGLVVDGTISRLESYGVFVKIDGMGMTGLLNIANISASRIEKVMDVFRLGDRVRVCIIGIQEGTPQKISLSTRVLEEQNGDMLKRKQWVFDNADELVKKYLARLEKLNKQMGMSGTAQRST
eukprot:TRINITY_DN2808_c0_g1_i2.p1 TRINITY_DN2808_c0_g1~~TRINITY_DN2808_c0_g1_i2.p1  ORF type:complete len:1487 (-),score=156.40 TRINITY_DN2808_c0_g1_i2:1382-5842(-)